MSYAGDVRGTKYSPLDQIDASNFADLEIAWEWTTVDRFISRATPGGGEWLAPLDTVIDTLIEDTPDLYRTGHRPILSRLQATPLMVGGVLYFNTPLSQGVAVDAANRRDAVGLQPEGLRRGNADDEQPLVAGGASPTGPTARGTSGSSGAPATVTSSASTRRPGSRAPTSAPAAAGGWTRWPACRALDREERDYLNALLFGIHSPPIVVRDKVIHGSHVADRRITKEAVPGWVRAWDVRTGEHAWDFHTVPNGADEFGVDTWLNESWRYSGNANVWSMLAGDNELGHVYLPTGTATNDYYGVDRLGDNLFSETLIAVDVETGQREWHFQAVHHGLWDYDFATHPNLVDVVVDGRPDQGDRAGEQAGLRLRVRPRHRRSDLADRGAPGTAGDEHAGRGAGAHPAVPDQAGPVRLPGGHHRRPGRLHAGDPADGDRGGRGLPARTAVHAAGPSDRRA